MRFFLLLMPCLAFAATNYDYEGIVKLSNCSGSFVRFETSQGSDQGMILTNGHCLDGFGFMEPGEVVVNKSSSRSFDLMDTDMNVAGSVQAEKILYATMTKTDMALYRLNESFDEIEQQYNVRPLTLSSVHPTAGMDIDIISGYWETGFSCKISGFVFQLKEENYLFEDSLRYTQPGCETIHGTSGSPVIEQGTRTVVGVNNTGNDSGKKCTMNNPCEIDIDGNITYKKGESYAQQTYWVYSCLNQVDEIDLNKVGCLLPR